MSDLFTVPVHPIALGEGDFLPTDPDDPQREARWWITSQARYEDTVIVVNYVTEDGTVGTHGFEDGSVLVEVVPPFAAPPAPQPRSAEPAVGDASVVGPDSEPADETAGVSA